MILTNILIEWLKQNNKNIICQWVTIKRTVLKE